MAPWSAPRAPADQAPVAGRGREVLDREPDPIGGWGRETPKKGNSNPREKTAVPPDMECGTSPGNPSPPGTLPRTQGRVGHRHRKRP